MDDADLLNKLAELDRMLNDPNSKMEPERVWLLLAEIARTDAATADVASPV